MFFFLPACRLLRHRHEISSSSMPVIATTLRETVRRYHNLNLRSSCLRHPMGRATPPRLAAVKAAIHRPPPSPAIAAAAAAAVHATDVNTTPSLPPRRATAQDDSQMFPSELVHALPGGWIVVVPPAGAVEHGLPSERHGHLRLRLPLRKLRLLLRLRHDGHLRHLGHHRGLRHVAHRDLGRGGGIGMSAVLGCANDCPKNVRTLLSVRYARDFETSDMEINL